MKQLIKSYSQSIEDTHVQVGQVSASLMTVVFSLGFYGIGSGVCV